MKALSFCLAFSFVAIRPATSEKLVMDLSMGTTGTRWLTEHMDERCFKTMHNGLGGRNPTQGMKSNTSWNLNVLQDRTVSIART